MVKAKLYRQNHTQKHTHTHTKREKGKKIYIYRCSQSPPQFGMICCLFRYSTDAGHIKLFVELYSAASEAAGRDFPFSSLFAQLPVFSFGFGPASACRSPEGVCSRSDRRGLKEQLLRGLWLTQAVGREGYGGGGASLRRQRRRDVAPARGAPCILPGMLSLDHRTLAVAGCTGYQEGRCV